MKRYYGETDEDYIGGPEIIDYLDYGKADQGIQISQKENYNRCPECQGQMIQQMHEYVCADCGLIVDELSFIPSYQINEIKNTDINGGEQFVSVGKVVDNVCNLGTHIGYYSNKIFYDYRGEILSSNQQHVFHKLKLWYSLPLKIKNHETDYRILKILHQMWGLLQITNDVKNRAAYLYQRRKKDGHIRNHITLIAACIGWAARETKAPISIREIVKAFQQTGHRVGGNLILRDMLEMKAYVDKISDPHTAIDFIARYVSTLHNDAILIQRLIKKGCPCNLQEYLRALEAIAGQINTFYYNQSKRKCCNPSVLAAAMVYASVYVIKQQYEYTRIVTQRILSQHTGVEEYAIRDHYVKIIKPLIRNKQFIKEVEQVCKSQ
jgi:transcription initiation factor TFIIIB Brf1 subunit/transcription initiation factor TFIIB